MKCKKCNAEVNSNFCPHCGTPVLNNASNQKLLGFRSNKTWKKVISILYLSICLIIFFFSIISSKQENISTYDFIIDKFFQIILCFVFISPYIFLSNTNFRDELPFFKKHKFIYSIFGMFIVLFIFTISISIVNSLHSEEYILKISKSSDSISGINKIETSEESETSSSSNYTNSNINGSEKKDDNIKKPNKNTQNYNDSENKLSESNIIDNQTSELLKKMAIEEVESELIFPKKAVFSWYDWTYGCYNNLYYVSSYVNTESIVGTRNDNSFTVIYRLKNNKYKLVYFILDDTIITDKLKKDENQILDTISKETKNYSDEIVLVYGDLGKYGKEISLDGCDYINFHIPQGTYLVRNNSEWCTLYITKNEYFRNADGYMENEIIQTIVFDNKNQTSTITITEGQQIEITINGNLTLIPQN